jgi:hypothetical protein
MIWIVKSTWVADDKTFVTHAACESLIEAQVWYDDEVGEGCLQIEMRAVDFDKCKVIPR